MFKLFRESFNITNNCIIAAVPLIVFLSLLGYYINYALSAADTIPKFILAAVTAIVLFCGCLSGWLYMLKKAMFLSKRIFVFDKDRTKALWNLLLSLPRGVGRLFLPILGIVLIYFIVYSGLFSAIGMVIAKYAGSFDFEAYNTASVFISSKELIAEINELPRQDLIIINFWNIAGIIITMCVSFLTMLWIPEVVYGVKNPYTALWIAVRNLFKTFKRSIVVFLYIAFLIVSLSILNTLLMFNPFLYFFVLILYYYFLIYAVVLLFTYYEQEFTN